MSVADRRKDEETVMTGKGMRKGRKFDDDDDGSPDQPPATRPFYCTRGHRPAKGPRSCRAWIILSRSQNFYAQNAHSYSSPLSGSDSNLLKLRSFHATSVQLLALLLRLHLHLHRRKNSNIFLMSSCLEREIRPGSTGLAFTNDNASLLHFPRIGNTEVKTTSSTSFPILSLPSELRTEIYAHYFASLPPLSITLDNVTSAIHNQTNLSLSSPYFESDILPSIFYSNCTFSFSNPKALKNSARGEGGDRVARVKVEYGTLSQCHRTDWVFLLFQNFEHLREVTFSFDADGMEWDGSCFGQWLGCVQDAMREAVNSRVEKRGRGENAGVMLMVECGSWNVCERVGGC